MPLFGPPNVEKLRAKGDINRLIKALTDRDPGIRDAARKALITIGSLAVEPLIVALGYESVRVRRNAASALGEIGDRRAVDALILALKDADWHVCHHAAASLGLLRDARAVEPLIMALNHTGEQRPEDPFGESGQRECVGRCARQALVDIGAPAVESLVVALKRGEAIVRVRSAMALGNIADPRSVEPLIAATRDTDDRVRGNAIYSLGQIGDRCALEAIVRTLGDSSEDVRENAKRALKTIGVDALAQDALVDMLRDSGARERPFIIKKLDELGWQPDDGEAGAFYWATKQKWGKCVQIGAPAVEALIAELRVQRNIDIAKTLERRGDARAVHTHIIEALGEIGDARAAQALIDVILLQGDRFRAIDYISLWQLDVQVCRAAAAALGKLGEPAIGPILQAPYVKQRESYISKPSVVDMLIEWLNHITDARAVEPLIAILRKNGDEYGQTYAARALGKIGDARAVEALETVLQDKSRPNNVRWETAKALGEIGDARAVETLVTALQDEMSPNDVRTAAAFSLGQIGDARAVEPLISVLEGLKTDTYDSRVRVTIQSLGQFSDRRACAPLIEFLFRSIDDGYALQRDYFQPLHNLFEDYTRLITDLIGYTPQYKKVFDPASYSQMDAFCGCIVKKNQEALDQLCSINTLVSNNLLHQISNFQSLTMFEVCKPSFDGLGRKAKEELIRRGNPPYNPSVYLDAAAWKIPYNPSVYLDAAAWKIPEHPCPQCGSPISDNAVRCHKCGHRFG